MCSCHVHLLQDWVYEECYRARLEGREQETVFEFWRRPNLKKVLQELMTSREVRQTVLNSSLILFHLCEE